MSQLLDALELLYYADRFRGQLFAFVLGPEANFAEVVTDLRVLQTTAIETVVFCPYSKKLEEQVEQWNKRGARFAFSRADTGTVDLVSWAKAAKGGAISVVAFEAEGEREAEFFKTPTEFATSLKARKIFFLSSHVGLHVEGKSVSAATLAEVDSILSQGLATNVDRNFLSFIRGVGQGRDLVLLEARTGAIFREIFTHRGAGTLFTEEYPNVIRQATLADVAQLISMMTPYIQSGRILAIGEEDVAAAIGNYQVYTVNDAVVASARLVSYGEACELAQFCTLPRYQGKGRARELAEHLIELCREQGKKYVFALSVEPRMWSFFEGLGFAEVEREVLPQQWQEGYDFSRESKALRLAL